VALAAIASRPAKKPRVLASSIEHPAVRKTVLSLEGLGCDPELIPVDKNGQIDLGVFDELLTPETLLVSVHEVNNILGTILPVEELARRAKKKVPDVIFHTDAVQAFGKIPVPRGGSSVDLVSISGHKIEGPKGVGALIVLNPDLLKKQRLRPLVWGGEQEAGLRSGTQNAGLIAGFGAAAQAMIPKMEEHSAKVQRLREHLRERLKKAGLLDTIFLWSSPEGGIPHIVSLCAPTLPGPMLARSLDEQGYLISTGSACSSGKFEPDPVLTACGYPAVCRASNLRISFSHRQTLKEVDGLADALEKTVGKLKKMMTG
jgi:cysteine desulfurase